MRDYFSYLYNLLGGTHAPCYVMTVGRTGQFVGLVCSGEGLDELNDMNVYLKCGL